VAPGSQRVGGLCYDKVKRKGKMIYELEEIEGETQYNEFLDEVYPVVKIGYLTFYPSQILKECDPIAYRIGLQEYLDSLAEE
jgi:hypothetical protein